MCVLTADASDHLERERRLAAGPGCSPPLRPRLFPSLGEVALELAYGHLFPDAFADVGPALDRLVRAERVQSTRG